MPNGKQPNPNENIDLYREWTNAVIATARLLIPYQRPTYRSTCSRGAPQHDHCAVIVAEDILSRFLNVISLFNGTIPLIAIQMQAYKVGDHFTLIFSKVLDELTRGPVDEDEEAEAAPTDRKYWEEDRASKETLQLTDELFAIVREFDPALELKYNKFYIGLARKGRADNFVTFTPRKRTAGIEPRIPRTDELDAQIKSSGLDL